MKIRMKVCHMTTLNVGQRYLSCLCCYQGKVNHLGRLWTSLTYTELKEIFGLIMEGMQHIFVNEPWLKWTDRSKACLRMPTKGFHRCNQTELLQMFVLNAKWFVCLYLWSIKLSIYGIEKQTPENWIFVDILLHTPLHISFKHHGYLLCSCFTVLLAIDPTMWRSSKAEENFYTYTFPLTLGSSNHTLNHTQYRGSFQGTPKLEEHVSEYCQ